ncbi:hypothetical protein HDV00_005295 [Rhizophlyctis rosea]|nr:hypothetical protein HDV00_005295 [Rhizophlyctis rosea]
MSMATAVVEKVEEPLPLDEAVRSLASVQIIQSIKHHPNAERLDIAHVLGWQVIIKRDEYRAGDTVIYIEIDSQCPATADWAAPLAAKQYRVETIKMRGELSQGFVIPLETLPNHRKLILGTDVTRALGITKYVPEPTPEPESAPPTPQPDSAAPSSRASSGTSTPLPGIDSSSTPAKAGQSNTSRAASPPQQSAQAKPVQNEVKSPVPVPSKPKKSKGAQSKVVPLTLSQIQMKVAQPKFALPQASTIEGEFPKDIIPKTDEPRIQSYPDLIEDLLGKPYYISIKYDGTSATYFIDPTTHAFTVCSRNRRMVLPNSLTLAQVESTLTTGKTDADTYWQPAVLHRLPEKLNALHPNIAIQAEIYGPRIQKNPLEVPHLRLAAFNAYDLTTGQYLPYADLKRVCGDLDIEMCEVVEVGEKFAYGDVEVLLKMAKGVYKGTDNPREGIVVRPQVEKVTRRYKAVRRLSFKVINNDFLLLKEKK